MGLTPRAFSISAGVSKSLGMVEWVSSTSQAAQAKLIDLLQGIRVLPIVLDHVDVVGGGQKTGEGGRLGVP
jgi:hypothetical protein